jgi:hypothetical protein
MFCRSLFVLFLLAIMLSVLLRYTDTDYPFGIFKLFLCIFQKVVVKDRYLTIGSTRKTQHMCGSTFPTKLCNVHQQRSTKHTHKTKDRVTRTPLKTRGELRCSGRVSSSCSTSGTHGVNLVTNTVISHEWGKDQEVLQVEYIRGYLWHRYSITIVSIASLLAATIYKWNAT